LAGLVAMADRIVTNENIMAKNFGKRLMRFIMNDSFCDPIFALGNSIAVQVC